MNGREAALEALRRCRRAGAWSDSVLESILAKSVPDEREAALATRLCYGVLQRASMCDFYIDCYSTTKSRRLEPQVLDILRLGVYQLVYMDKIPASAAVNTAVELCRSAGCGRASGLVNAVLRRIAAEREHLPEPDDEDSVRRLAVRTSHPEWLVQAFLERIGLEETEALLYLQNAPVETAIQVNTLRTTQAALEARLAEEGISARPHPWLENCLLLPKTGNLTALTSFQEGAFYVQDAAARLAVLASGVKAGDTVLDACAAPGGKSFAAAIQMENTGHILSCDLHKGKLGRVAQGAQRLGISIVETRVLDARSPEALGIFDTVLADVPCSGLGVIRKKPDIRYKEPQALAALLDIQLAILRNVAGYVRPGGVLLYATCTLLRRENEDVVAAFLQENSDFAPEAFPLPGPVGMCAAGEVTLWPQHYGTDGFFIAKLRRAL